MSDLSDLPIAETIIEADEGAAPRVRDRIVILGRRAAGKTVYLSVLYEKYWRSLDGLTMKAVSGAVHSDLIRTVEGLRAGQWPAATLETQHCDLEIKFKGQKYLLVALDYAGELFRRAFVEDLTDSPETQALVRHLDSAAAVILLIDPAIVVGKNVDAAIDDDFGMTQAVTRIRNWPGGKQVPFVLAFTKADENRPLIAREGGIAQFMLKRFPALSRTLKKAVLFEVAAVQVETTPEGERRLRPDFKSYQIEKPLMHCLEVLAQQREAARQESLRRQRHLQWLQEEEYQRQAARRGRNTLIAIVVSMIVVAACIIALVWVYKK
jgi:hypothetical protein